MHVISGNGACKPKFNAYNRMHARFMLESEHPADCIYINGRDNRHFGVGLYCLEDVKSQHRIGGISIYDIQSALEACEDPNYCSANTKFFNFDPKMYINTESGVVNFEWDSKNENFGDSDFTHITCLCSDKSLKFFRIDPDFSSYKLLSSVKSENVDNNNQIIGLDLSCICNNSTR